MKCFYCEREASAKIGEAKGNIWKALLGMKSWSKNEMYVCRKHYLLLNPKKCDNCGLLPAKNSRLKGSTIMDICDECIIGWNSNDLE